MKLFKYIRKLSEKFTEYLRRLRIKQNERHRVEINALIQKMKA